MNEIIVDDMSIRSKRHDAVNQMPSLVEDPLCHTDVLKEQQRFWKRILIVDDDNDITTTFKAAIEDSNNGNDANKRIEVYTSNDPVVALLEFTPNFYDLLLVDINMPHMNGFELCEKILAIDITSSLSAASASLPGPRQSDNVCHRYGYVYLLPGDFLGNLDLLAWLSLRNDINIYSGSVAIICNQKSKSIFDRVDSILG